MLAAAFHGRRVLVTGHTGFKGSWLAHWLCDLGAKVTGLALAPDPQPALFDILGLRERLAAHHLIDIRDATAVARVVAQERPEVVLHLAAQPLVRLSYQRPKETWDVNVGGTVNLLEAVRAVPSVVACVVVTSDKCYENREQVWGYRECDAMGGHDPYSSSKGAVELAVASWRRSFFADGATCRLASARAGNVIGGGDRCADRIVVDFMRAMTAGVPLRLRNPHATRPWQHVLEPLSGYLWLAARLLADDGRRYADGWNFGPGHSGVATVEHLARTLVAAWGVGTVESDPSPSAQSHEAGLLSLDVSKAHACLGWRGAWSFAETVDATIAWYRAHHEGADSNALAALTGGQITAYTASAARAGQPWAAAARTA